MNERYESTRFALDDDALDGLLSGDIDPSLTDMGSNPVASFFAEVRSTSFADSPQPDPRLNEVFAGAPSAPTGTTRAVGRGQLPTGATPPVGFGPNPTGATPPVGVGPNPTGSEPTMVNWAGSSEFDDMPAPTRVRKNPGFVSAAPIGVYRPSALEATINALRPTPSKILVGVSVLLVMFISVQILWFSDSPDDELQEVAGVETSTVTTLVPADAVGAAPTVASSVVESTESVPTTEPAPAPVDPAPAPAPTANTTTPTRPPLGPTAPTVPTSPTTTPTVPTSPVDPTVASSETTVDPATTLDPNPTVTMPITTGTIVVTEPPPPTETTIPTATISPGRVSSVPGTSRLGSTERESLAQGPATCRWSTPTATNRTSRQRPVPTSCSSSSTDPGC